MFFRVIGPLGTCGTPWSLSMREKDPGTRLLLNQERIQRRRLRRSRLALNNRNKRRLQHNRLGLKKEKINRQSPCNSLALKRVIKKTHLSLFSTMRLVDSPLKMPQLHLRSWSKKKKRKKNKKRKRWSSKGHPPAAMSRRFIGIRCPSILFLREKEKK